MPALTDPVTTGGDAVQSHAGDVSLATKVLAETAAPPFVRTSLDRDDGVGIARRLAAAGYDALVPVEVSVYWDMSVVRGEFPARAWAASDLQADYEAAFGGPGRARAVRLLNRLEGWWFPPEGAWNAGFYRAVRDVVAIPVLCEGSDRGRTARPCSGTRAGRAPNPPPIWSAWPVRSTPSHAWGGGCSGGPTTPSTPRPSVAAVTTVRSRKSPANPVGAGPRQSSGNVPVSSASVPTKERTDCRPGFGGGGSR